MQVKRTQRYYILIPDFERAVSQGLADLAQDVKDEAQKRVPVDTGALFNSIDVKQPQGTDPLEYEVTAGGTSDVDYAAFVEFGTRNAAAQPYMIPAARAVNPVTDIVRNIRRLIRRARV